MESTAATGPQSTMGRQVSWLFCYFNKWVRQDISSEELTHLWRGTCCGGARATATVEVPMKLSSELVHLGYNAGMVVHTLHFAGSRACAEDEKLRALAEIRGLQGQIPGLLETWVGVNVSPRSRGYELGGVMKFADRSALDAYGAHPVHQKLLQWLMPLIDPLEVDFEA